MEAFIYTKNKPKRRIKKSKKGNTKGTKRNAIKGRRWTQKWPSMMIHSWTFILNDKFIYFFNQFFHQICPICAHPFCAIDSRSVLPIIKKWQKNKKKPSIYSPAIRHYGAKANSPPLIHSFKGILSIQFPIVPHKICTFSTQF
jgi:hypothetical protein